jgi:hypothetical protein
MRALLGSVRHLILGETWTIPAGVGLTLALALGLRAVLPDEACQHAGGFALASLVIATLAWSLSRRS